MNIVPSNLSTNGAVYDSEIILNFRQTKVPVGFKEAFPLSVTIRNSGQAIVLKDSILEVECGEFFEKESRRLPKALAHGENTAITLELNVTGNADITTLPDEISIRVLHPSSKMPYFCKHSGFNIELCITHLSTIPRYFSPTFISLR